MGGVVQVGANGRGWYRCGGLPERQKKRRQKPAFQEFLFGFQYQATCTGIALLVPLTSLPSAM